MIQLFTLQPTGCMWALVASVPLLQSKVTGGLRSLHGKGSGLHASGTAHVVEGIMQGKAEAHVSVVCGPWLCAGFGEPYFNRTQLEPCVQTK